jgi:hypothetical protein
MVSGFEDWLGKLFDVDSLRRSRARARRTRGTNNTSLESLEPRVLLAATLTRVDSVDGSAAFTDEFVRMDLGDFKVIIDTLYGGSPSRWYNGEETISVTNPFAGEGVTVMWDQGNDPTQGSANGPGMNPIARLDGQQLAYNYYARESLFDNGGGTSSTVSYEVTGFAPFFWISHEAGDDAIPAESLPQWRTLYNNPGDPSQITSDPSVPIFYQAAGTPDGAVMFLGDDIVASGTSWSQRLAEMREGRFAAKVRISLKDASNDAFAGLMFRRQIPDAADVSETAAYSSPGYTLNVNKAGLVQIVRVASQGALPVPVWTSAAGVAASTINTAAGALLELRTHNANGNVEIFLNGTKIGDYDDPQVLRGAHFGLYAQSSTGSIKFSDRQVFDVGTEYVARYTGHENGVLTTDIQIHNAGGVSSANQIYFAQMPSVWLGVDFRSDAVARFIDSSGIVIQEFTTGATASQILRGDDGNSNTKEPYALWLGSDGSSKGIFGIPQAAWINGSPADHPHAQIDVNNAGFYVVSMNPLPQYPQWPPASQDLRNLVTSLRMVTDWRPKLETISPLLVSISDQSVSEGNSGQKQATFTVSLNRMPTQIVSIPYATMSGTATSGVDFVATNGTLVFDPADGLLSKTISVLITGDTTQESNETFKLNLSTPKNAGIGDGEGIGTILNDDSLAAPTITAPSSTTAAQRPAILWNSVAGATSYDVTVDNLSTGTTSVISTTVHGTTYTPTIDLGIGRMRVRVRAMDASGGQSNWSSPKEFTINTPVVLKAIVAQQSTLRPQISWNALTGAVKYDLWVNNLSTGQSQVIRQRTLTGTSFTPASDLPLGQYRAWVAGIDAAGQMASWSAFKDFTIAKAPSPTSPLAGTFSRLPAFTWGSVPGATGYDIFIRNLTTGVTDFYPKGVIGNSWTPPSSMTDGPYRWWVQATGPGNVRSLWSPPIDIYIGGRPNVLGPAGTITARTPTFTWTAISGAASYQLWLNRLDVAQSAVINQSGITSASFTATSALAKGTYRIWIRALSTTGQWSPWSQSIDVTIASSFIKNPLEITLDTATLAVLQDSPVSSERVVVADPFSDLTSSHRQDLLDDGFTESERISASTLDWIETDAEKQLGLPIANILLCEITDELFGGNELLNEIRSN